MSEYCIELKNVTKKFGKFTAVDDVSIRLEPGKVYGFVGPNGAGKSTTMAIIMGALFPTKGTGKVFDHPLATPGALKELGYPGFVSFECGCEGDPKIVLPAAVELLRKQWEEA